MSKHYALERTIRSLNTVLERLHRNRRGTEIHEDLMLQAAFLIVDLRDTTRPYLYDIFRRLLVSHDLIFLHRMVQGILFELDANQPACTAPPEDIFTYSECPCCGARGNVDQIGAPCPECGVLGVMVGMTETDRGIAATQFDGEEDAS